MLLYHPPRRRILDPNLHRLQRSAERLCPHELRPLLHYYLLVTLDYLLDVPRLLEVLRELVELHPLRILLRLILHVHAISIFNQTQSISNNEPCRQE